MQVLQGCSTYTEAKVLKPLHLLLTTLWTYLEFVGGISSDSIFEQLNFQDRPKAFASDRCHAPNVFGTVDMEKVSR